jgi:hypothetical protein
MFLIVRTAGAYPDFGDAGAVIFRGMQSLGQESRIFPTFIHACMTTTKLERVSNSTFRTRKSEKLKAKAVEVVRRCARRLTSSWP